jgi:methyl-accepting chemotaxis protein
MLFTNKSIIGIIGGGKVGQELLNLFNESDLTTVAYVMDIEPTAPALVAAKRSGIKTYTDLQWALKSTPVDYLFEVTGSDKVVEKIIEISEKCETRLVTHEMAHIIIEVIREKTEANRDMVSKDIIHIKDEIAESLDGTSKLLDGMDEIASNMRMLTLNARIEAARAGVNGRGFDVVAQEMGRYSDDIQQIVGEIKHVNKNILTVSEQIESSLEKLN